MIRLTAMTMLIVYGAAPALAGEGQWTPEQVASLPATELERLGMKMPAERLWNGEDGLIRAAVNYSGCSAGFVSGRGLILTNYHCAHPAIQAASTPKRDLLRSGFVARTLDEEVPAQGRSEIDVLVAITDVTETVRASIDAADDDRSRAEAALRTSNVLAAECEKDYPGHRCQVASFFFGKTFRLFRTLHIEDVRLVYAPPEAIGEYGGEIDNWSWPRHTGDFALLRAYVGPNGKPAPNAPENVPFEPDVYFSVSRDGVREGDAVAVLGYPGHTDRYWSARGVRYFQDVVFPSTAALYGTWVRILERASKSRARAIKAAAHLKSLANREKNARGMVAGLQRMQLADRRAEFESKLPPEARELVEEMDALVDRMEETFPRDLLLDSIPRGPNLLAVATDIGRVALASKVEDEARDPEYAMRSRAQLWNLQKRRLQNYDNATDVPWLASLFVRAAKLPKDTRIKALSKYATRNPKVAAQRARALLRSTQLAKKGKAKALFNAARPSRLARSQDKLVRLGYRLAQTIERREAQRRAREGALLEVGPPYIEALEAASSKRLYPDANGTLRISFAHVRGYQVRDGLLAQPRTSVSGMLAKSTGRAPFALPAGVLSAAPRRVGSTFADRDLADVPACFLSTADTTGGSSGSPVVNSRGELVGANFDRVWENIAGDFAYNPAWSRNISVDVRLLLWMLADVVKAPEILHELGAATTSVPAVD